MKYSIFLIAITIASCAPKPFKGNTPSAEIAPYVESFFESWGQPSPEVAYNMIPLEGKAAECVWSDTGVRIVNIDPDSFWGFCKLEQKAMIWHELGHCILMRPHVDRPAVSYMTANIYGCQFIADNQAEMDIEMFSNN